MKKKLIALVSAMVLSITPAYATIPDISGLSLEELTELKVAVDAAVFEHGGKVEFAEGTYYVGRDIKAGSYTLYVPSDSWGINIGVFDNEDSYKSYAATEKYISTDYLDAITEYGIVVMELYHDKDATVNLVDGQILVIQGDTPSIAKAINPFAP